MAEEGDWEVLGLLEEEEELSSSVETEVEALRLTALFEGGPLVGTGPWVILGGIAVEERRVLVGRGLLSTLLSAESPLLGECFGSRLTQLLNDVTLGTEALVFFGGMADSK